MKDGLLSTAEVAQVLKVNESTVKRWTDSGEINCFRTPGGHRKYTMETLADFMGRLKYKPGVFIKFDELPNQQTEPALIHMQNTQALSILLKDMLIKGDRTGTYRILSLLYTNGMQPSELFDRVVQPALEEIGNGWADGVISIDSEHLASATMLWALSRLQSGILKKTAVNHLALGACLEGELHHIGLECVMNVLEAEGWRAMSLGANLPVDSLVRAMKEHRPELVVVSATVPAGESGLANSMAFIHAEAGKIGARVVVGGHAVRSMKPGDVAADSIVHTMKDVVEFVRNEFKEGGR